MAASTGSPASRRSTKLTPLTTRPSLTSRQGMTRTLNITPSCASARGSDQSERRRGVEPAIIKRAARDGAGELLRARRQQGFHVLDRGEPARGNDRNGDRGGERDGGCKSEAPEPA